MSVQGRHGHDRKQRRIQCQVIKKMCTLHTALHFPSFGDVVERSLCFSSTAEYLVEVKAKVIQEPACNCIICCIVIRVD